MRRTAYMLIPSVLTLALAFAPAFAQNAGKVDLTGTWTGYTVLGDGTRAEFSLILEKEGPGYSGKITSESGMIPDMPIRDVTFRDLLLDFAVDFPDSSGPQPIKIELKFENNMLKGGWADPNGNSNVIELQRKK